VAELRGVRFAQPTCQLVPPTVPGYRPYTVAPDASGDWKAPDLVKARALVDASGTRGQKVVVWSEPDFRKEAEYFVALLRQLGYRARLHALAGRHAYEKALDRHPSARHSWMSLPAELARFCDSHVDAEVARLGKEEPADPAGTAGLAAAIDREITDEAPWVPLYIPRLVDLTSARVGNYHVSNGAVLLDQLWVR
jgi:peptide/nickel transport system substrate-binding protein